ncbi:MAG: LacI family transcriptional regulator [Lachnospiraceae bacterium]|nr:LacI family transcriptional regulator [Lachnospiraceae bacterium]
MKTKVTVQDIADCLHLSRITVSKALNNSPNVSEETREMVLRKAREMNYKSVPYSALSDEPPDTGQSKSFAFVMQMNPDAFHIGSGIMAQLEQEIRKKGYSLTLHTITEQDISSMSLPANLNENKVAAAICLEMFHPEYSRLICSLGIPVLFIDACVHFRSLRPRSDLLLMENRSSVHKMLTAVYEKHPFSTMGFVGDIDHCLSFRERYEGFLLAAVSCGIETQPYHMIAPDRHYGEPGWMLRQLQNMEKLPDLFCCANDALAQMLIQNLRDFGRRVPEDVMVCGFDGISFMNPAMNCLTTVNIPCRELGACAARLLFQRMPVPDKIHTVTYVETEICLRNTTR